MWTDLVVRNTQITRPGGSSFYTKGGNGWDSLYNMGYEFDAAGDIGFTNSYIGVKFLGSTPLRQDNCRYAADRKKFCNMAVQEYS